MKNIILTLLISLTATVCVNSQQLPRKAWFGARLDPIDSNNFKEFKLNKAEGLVITEIAGGTSKEMGFLVDDVIVNIDGKVIESIPQLRSTFLSKKEGETISFSFYRNGELNTKNGIVKGKNREIKELYDVIYDQAPFKSGKLSVIINKPKKTGKLPAVLFVSGTPCISLDNLPEADPYQRIISAYTEAGFVVLRVEKSGMGDSQNTPDCSSINLLDEIENYQAGLDKLKTLKYVDSKNIFIFGHSGGGIIVPALSAKNDVRGVVVYGVVSKSYFEHSLEANRLQSMLGKPDALDFEQNSRLNTSIAYEFYFLKKPLNDIASTAERKKALTNEWAWDGNNTILGRNHEYFRQIQDNPIIENWRNTKCKVLVEYGGADFQTFSKADHEQIVYTVNQYHPDNATLIVFPESDHSFAKSGSKQKAYNMYVRGEAEKLYNLYDTSIGEKTVEWTMKQIVN